MKTNIKSNVDSLDYVLCFGDKNGLIGFDSGRISPFKYVGKDDKYLNYKYDLKKAEEIKSRREFKERWCR